MAKELGIGLSSCAAIGDSRSDLALFQVVDLSIGLTPARMFARSLTYP